jgi:hypothetical protein
LQDFFLLISISHIIVHHYQYMYVHGCERYQ